MDTSYTPPAQDAVEPATTLNTPTPIPVLDPAPVQGPKVGSLGSVIAILLIVLLLVVGAFYVWGQRLSEKRAMQLQEQSQ